MKIPIDNNLQKAISRKLLSTALVAAARRNVSTYKDLQKIRKEVYIGEWHDDISDIVLFDQKGVGGWNKKKLKIKKFYRGLFKLTKTSDFD